MFEESSSPGVSNAEPSSSDSRADPEMGLKRRNASNDCCGGINLDPARTVLAELVGSFILMYCICGIISSTQLMKGEVGLLEYAATGGLSTIVVIFSIATISGSHVNPAVTLAFAVCGHFPWIKVPLYISAQVMGCVLASYVGSSVYNMNPELLMTKPSNGDCASAFWAEAIATFIVMFVATSLTYQAQSVGHLSGVVIGLSIGLAILITGPVSGGSLNPARSLGPAIVSWKFDTVWIYLAAPTIGAASGVLLLRFLHLREYS